VAALKALTSELLARENDLRWWSLNVAHVCEG
jgi:hypothetical protein